MIKVGVIGASGKMGKEVVRAVFNDKDCELVLAVDKFNVEVDTGYGVIIEDDIKGGIINKKPDIVVDFTQPSTIYENINTYLDLGVKSVIGTTGLKNSEIEAIKEKSNKLGVGCFIAPNFTIGAVLMMMFAKSASKYFENAEIIEYHHNQKKDAPSGTAIKTAELMASVNDNLAKGNAEEKETIVGSRGGVAGSNIHIHSVRMPGFMASQEVLFGAPGQILKIRHDSVDRACYMSGVLLAIKYLNDNNNFTYGLENIL